MFVPRPETEVLVDWAIDGDRRGEIGRSSSTCSPAAAPSRWRSPRRGPDAGVHGVERAPGALAWARRNAELQAAEGRTPIRLLGGDVFDERLLADLDGPPTWSPPTRRTCRTATPVEPEVRDHDPADAVFAGPDGLAVIRPLLSVAAALLKPGGRLAIEHDDTQGESAPALLAARRLFADVVDHQDLAGRPRFVTATRVSLRS